jgi:hypothetical protein
MLLTKAEQVSDDGRAPPDYAPLEQSRADCRSSRDSALLAV